MNRRNFVGRIGAAVAGLVLGSNGSPVRVKPAEDTWGFAVGDNLLLKPGAVTWDNTNGLRLFNDLYPLGELHVRTFTADEVRVGGGAVYWDNPPRWTIGIGDDDGELFKITANDVDWYGAWL